jgi:hypothetical protein
MNKNGRLLIKPVAGIVLMIAFVLAFSLRRLEAGPLLAGFARVKITPPLGTPLSGFGDRDFDPAGARGVHDDLFVRALYLSQGNQVAIIMGFDLLFFSREEADRFKGAVGNKLGLTSRQILLNTSHTHTGPKVGNWYYSPSDPLYLQDLEAKILSAAVQAKRAAEPVTIWAGETRTTVPLSRRLRLGDGTVKFAPNPAGVVYDYLPFAVMKGEDGKSVSVLFSVSCHPSTIKGDERASFISADFPGAAADEIDKMMGKPCALFLQGAGGDAKASVIGRGLDEWRAGTWEDVEQIGKAIALEIKNALSAGQKKIRPALRTHLVEMLLPLAERPSRGYFLEIIEKAKSQGEIAPVQNRVRRIWAEEQLHLLERGFGLRSEVPVLVQGIDLGEGLRVIGVEGELVGELGRLVRDFYGAGITFPLGYSNGAQMYLPTSAMIDEGGYEVESYWEYRQPAPLAKGWEAHLTKALEDLKKAGIK